MFSGAIPQHMQAVLYEVVEDWNVTDIYVGCSGAFTVERVLAPMGRFRIHSNDVTLYTAMLGWYFSGEDVMSRIALHPDREDQWAWLRPYMTTPEDLIATVMLTSTIAEALTPDGTFKRNAYYDRLVTGYRHQWQTLHAKTVAKLTGSEFKIASYHNGDVVDWLSNIPADAGFIAYPPFQKVGAAQKYEKQAQRLETVFTWDKPEFPLLSDERIDQFFHDMTDRDWWAFGANHLYTEYDKYLRGFSQLTNRGTTFYMYASHGPRRVITPSQNISHVAEKRLMPGDEVGDTMTLHPLHYTQFQALRSQYMNIGIRPGAASLAVAVKVDDRLVGVFAWSVAPTQRAAVGAPDTIYQLSDFPVAPHDYPRLSKLILYAATSTEAKLLAERLAGRRIRYALTTAYSYNRESMKYRGVFKKHTVKPNPTTTAEWGDNIDLETNPYYRRPWQINYLCEFGQYTLDEGLAIWKKKHGKRVANAGRPDTD